MKWRWLIVFFIALGITACRQSADQAGIEKEQLADAVLRKTATQVKRETELRPCGTIGQMFRQVQILGLSFSCNKPVDIVEGRKLLLKAADTLIEQTNQETRIHTYLSNYPFTIRNVEIEIFLQTLDSRNPAPDALHVITIREGELRYKIDNPKNNRFLTIYKETYQEALDRIANPTLPLASFAPDPEFTSEELASKRMQVSFVSDDGSIWHLGPNGAWIKEQN